MVRHAVALTALCAACAKSPPAPPVEKPARTTLVDVSADLREVLDRPLTDGACARWNGGARDRPTELACGKWMFFHETFGTQGLPAALTRLLATRFPNEAGRSFERWGLYADPDARDALPIGFAPAAPIGRAEAVGFTCAACHFARLPDGRFAVGAANHRFAYGKLSLALLLVPELGTGHGSPAAHDPEAVALVEPLVARVRDRPSLRVELLSSLLPLVLSGQPAPRMSREVERAYARWPTGAMDFLVAPLAVDDGVPTVSKVSALWNLPSAEELERAGMDGAELGWTGSVRGLGAFTEAFVAIFGGRLDEWPPERRAPLEAYVSSLRAPANPSPPPDAEVQRGRALFASRGCLACHDGPSGGGRRIFRYDEIGTDAAMARWLDPELTGTPCCGARWPRGERLTHGLKSPRLAGLWTFSRFLHNGTVPSLERLFCLDGARGVGDAGPGLADGGHDFTCHGLDPDEKRALIAYLETL